jgi:hypothetical protein
MGGVAPHELANLTDTKMAKTIKVRAKYQLAYNNKLYLCGDVFEILSEDYDRYQGDVEIVRTVANFRKQRTKKITSKKKKK